MRFGSAEIRGRRHTSSESIADEVNSVVMYRGDNKNPNQILGPAYFASDEDFALTYGRRTAAWRLHVRKPLVVTEEGWRMYAKGVYGQGGMSAVDRLRQQGDYDSVVLKSGDLYLVFLVDSKNATLLEKARR